MGLINLENEIRPTVFVLVGPPASGKSTWRENFLANSVRPVTTISSDDYVDNYADVHGLTYSEAFTRVDHKEIKKVLVQQTQAAVQREHDIVFDRTNLTPKSRRSALGPVTSRYRKVAVVFEVSEEELARRLQVRADATGKHIPHDVMEDMMARYTPPESSEGFDDIIHVRSVCTTQK